LRRARQSLHDWIDHILISRSAANGDRAQILTNAEWLGVEVDEEIERVRREESQRKG
jgi:hypothetical protein